MKKYFAKTGLLMLMFVISISGLLSSCEKDPCTCNPNETTNNNSGNGSSTSKSGSLSVPSSISIGKAAGTVYIPVTSNTEWTVYVNNTGSSVNGLEVSPLSGNKDGTVQVKYGGISTTYYSSQSAVVVFYYYSYGYKQTATCSISRKGNYP